MKEVIEGFELSPQQKYTWQLQGEGALYSQCAILLEGALRIGALKSALEKVVQRNEILRTTFDCLPGMDAPIQTIFDEPRMSYREIDFSDCDPQEHEARIEELLREARDISFDFQEGPLAHFSLVILSASKAALCFCLPALCADSRTLKNLYHEIVQSYEATLAGEDVIDEPLQYIQFSEWQNELLEAEGAETGKHFWDEPRANEVKVSLPFETSRSSSPESVSPECLSFTVERDLAERLDALAELLGVSQGVLLLTCWQALLWRLTGESEITVHTSFDGRKYEELHTAMGPFTRYAPVQTHISENFRFSKMLKKVNESTQNAYMWLEYFIKERRGESDGYEDNQSDAIGFDYEQWPEPRNVRGVEFSFLKLNSFIDRFKLRLAASRCSDSIALDLHFLPSYFSLHSVNSLASHLLALLQAVAYDPDSLIEDLQILSEADLHNLLYVFNHSRYSTRPDGSIVSMFQQQVLQSPDRVAVGCLDDSLTFHQLNVRANQLAHYLIGKGITTESLVGICLTRSPEMIVSVLGIWKAGAAYIPLDPRQPSSRLSAMIEDANPSLIIMDKATAEQTGIKSDKTFLIDEQEEELSALRSDNPDVKIEGNNLAYVIYTSGSTGQPKGVMIEQASLLNLAYSLKESLYQRRSGQLRVSVNAPLAFDASIKQLIQVAAGHSLEVVPEEVRSDAREMVRYIKEQGIEVVDCTPSQLKQMLEEGLAEAEQSAGRSKQAGGKKGASKQAAGKIVVGGEAIDEQLWERLRGLEGRVVYNVYGPTECCVDATAARVSRSAAPTIGKALTNVEVYILDDEMRAVPAGVEGELYIGGAGVGRGYLRRAELTAEKFVPHPYSQRAGARLYRTGDVVRYNERGEIEYKGRADNQVKVRGYRVELGEIEAALRSKAGVKEAVAVVRQAVAGGEQIVGYVVVEESHEEGSSAEGSSEKNREAKRRYRLPNGQRIEQKNRNETEYLYEEIYEKQSYLRHGVRLPERGVVVDVGANIGMFTMFVGEHREGVKVYAIEPIEDIYDSLVANVAKYGDRVKAMKIGLGEESKQERYRYYEGYTMMSGVSEYASEEEEIEVIKKYLSNEEEQGIEGAGRLKGEVEEILAGRFEGGERECEVKRLSEVIREEGIERIELLKIDVQRAEEDVLRGIEEEDWEKIEQVVMELHDREGGESEGRKDRVKEELERRGFRVEVEQDEKLKGTDRYNLYAVRGEEARESERIEIREEREEEEGEGKEVSVEEIRKYVRGRVPEYMVPGVIVKLEELPLTRNGKVDRAALPLPEEVISKDDKEIEAPHNIYEELLVEIWAEVLKVEHLSIHDNFFELGGHSLLATQVMSRMRDAFNIEIPLRSLFQAPTVAQLAPLISELALQAEGVTAPVLTPVERAGELALSFAQQRLWFLNQLEPDSPFYNCPMALRLEGKLDQIALRRAIAEMIDRHEVLRTSFPVRDGKPMQQVGERGKFRLPVIDLTEMSGEQKRREVERLVAEEGQAVFDLSRGPLVRAKLIRESDEEHVIAVTMHHIVSDAWSKAIVVKEVAALYEAYSRGEQSPLAELRVQYGDYAEWQREWLQGEVLEAQLKYWREQLEGAPQMMEIATDRVRPAVQSYRGAKQGLRISREVSEKLRGMSRREGVTMYMSLLAGFKAMLMRYSGQTDIVVGTSIAGRNRLETEELIGFFVNTLVMRTDVGGDPTFKQLLRRVREVTLGAYAHQDIPFEKVVEELHPDRDLSRSPLFQITFAYQNATEERQSLTGVSVSGIGVENATAKFDLTLSMADTGEGIVAVMVYNTDLYEASSIERMLRHLERLIASGVAEPEKRISELSMLSEQEERLLLLDWNDTRREFLQDGSIIDLFEAQVEQTPDAVALVCEDQSLSYNDLNRRANQLAHYLISIGVGPEVKVGLCVDRTVDMIVAVVGVLKAGGAYVAIDPTHPKQRVADMLEDARAAVLLTQDRFIAELSQCDGHKVCLDSQWEMIAQYNDDNPINRVNLSNPAYVIYTSGSTGIPKGVIVEHKQLLNYVKGIREVLDLEQGASYASVSTLAADLGNTVIYPALCGGGTLHLISQERVADAEALAAYFGAQAIDCLKIVPSHLAALMSGSHPEQVLPCRRLVLGGESVSWEMIARINRLAPELKVINHYGPTETTVGVLTYEVGSAQAGGTGNVPLGRPIANGRVYVLGEQNEAVPVGVTGELYIGGSGVARGYLNRPDLTAERFLPDPFSIEPGARLYRSGDRARLLPDGNVEFLGRIDNQVKIRGFRIELGEIESALSQHEAAEQVAVIAKQDAAGDKRLVAYVGHCHQQKPDANELQCHLKNRLPEYMIPSAFVILETLPLMANGKIDRKALPAPTLQGQEPDAPALPRTWQEELLVEIWAEVLKVEHLSIHDNFFDLGGHSLLATQVMSRMRDAFNIEIPLRSLFQAPTVAQLAPLISDLALQAEGVTAPALTSVERTGELALSFAQQRLWFLNQLEPDSPFYNCPMALRLEGTLNQGALGRAIAEMIDRHEVLRTSFPVRDGKPMQQVGERGKFRLPVIDLTEMSGEQKRKEVERLVAEEGQAAFDLSRGPLVRAKLIRESDEEHVIAVTMHHIVSDAWSKAIVVKEVAVLYEAYSRGEQSPLAELRVQYGDYAVWQREWLQGEVLEAQLKYWREQLEGAPQMMEIATDRVRPAVQSYRGAKQGLRISREVSEKLRGMSRREGVTMYMSLLAGFKAMLMRYSGQTDIVVGTSIAGRNRLETEELIGFFVNTLVMRTDVGGDPTFKQLLRRVREVSIEAFSHQEIPFERIVEELQPERDLSRSPLFQILFEFQSTTEERQSLTGVSVSGIGVENATAKFDLTLSMADTGEGIVAVMVYNTDLYEASSIERMLRHLERLIASGVAEPEKRISELSMLSEQEERLLLLDWNDTEEVYADEKCMHELFEDQAARTPDAVAISSHDGSITYDELNRRSNRLARVLIDRSTGSEVLVGLLANRGIDFVTAFLAVMKAGGACLAFDPSHPSKRHQQILTQSNCPIVIAAEEFMHEMLESIEQLPELERTQVFSLEGLLDLHASDERIASSNLPNNLAYVSYTSGSTDIPKGAMIEHRGMLNHLLAKVKDLGLTASDTVAQNASQSFDISVWQSLAALLVGGRVHIIGDEVSQDPLSLAAEVDSAGISILETVPTLLRPMLELLTEKPTSQRPSFSTLRWLISNAEALPPDLCRAWFALYPEIRMLNTWGATECSDDVTHLHIERLTEDDFSHMPLGFPLINIQRYIVDENMNPVPIGIPGEICIAGISVGRGYMNEPKRTAERFLPNPFSHEPGQRLYKTGDLARFLHDGNIEFLGRLDHQVKIRGFRIELSEIEAALALHPSIAQPLVLARQDHTADKRLVAYFSCSDHQHQLDASELRAFLKLRLPDYMIPSAFVQLDTFPLTSNGKIDRAALPAPEPVRLDELAYQAPRSESERILAEIWQQVLRIEKVSVTDNFFELGGDSILSIQIIARANQRGLHLTARQMFQHQTVEELAEVAGVSRTVEAEQGRVSGEVPLTPIQRWFFEQEIEDRNHFNQSVLFEVDEEVRADWIEEIVGLLVEHHDALRMRYSKQQGGEWKQTNLVEEKQRVYEYLDMSQIEESLQRAAIERACEQAQESLIIQSGPMIRVVQMGLGEGRRGRLLIVIHHLVVDGVSWRVLLEELQSGYEQKQRGEQIRLAEKTTSFKRWAEQMGEQATSEWMKEEAGYWKEEARKRVRRLPVDKAGGENTRESGRVVSAGLSKEETEELLKGVAETYHTQINEVLMAGLVEAIGEWVGERRVRVEMEGHGREEVIEGADVTRTVGWFTSVYPVVVDVEGIEGVGEELREVKEQMRRIPRKGIGYGMKRYLGGGIEEEQAAEVSFNYLGQLDQMRREEGWLRGAAENKGEGQGREGNRGYLIEVNGAVKGGHLQMHLTYSEQVHERETIERVAQRYMEALRRIIRESRKVEATGYTPSDFPKAKLSRAELEKLLSRMSED